VPPAETGRVVEWNDLDALAAALADEDVACVLAEPALTKEAFARTIALGERFEAGVQDVIDRRSLPWHVTRIDCRVEYLFRPERPRTGSEAAAGGDALLDRLAHLWALNRGILLTPFHTMALMCPATSEEDVDLHTRVFDELAAALAG
jgi:glutamate-1-semialdehyde 2,1-aminomutase